MTGRSRRVAVVLHLSRQQPWGERVTQDLRAGLRDQHLFLQFAQPDGDAARQVELLEDFLKLGVDALVVAPIDGPRVQPVLRRYREARVPVVVVDSDPGDPALYDTLILADHRHIGRIVAGFFIEAMGGRGPLVEVHGLRVTPAAIERSAGFHELIDRQPGMHVLDACEGGWLHERAREAFAGVLTRHRRIDGVFAHNDEMARGVHDAAVAAGRAADVLVAGVDALPGERGSIHLVSQGTLAATCLNPSPGKQAAHAVLSLLAGEPVQKKVLLKTSLIQSRDRVRAWRQVHRP